MTTPVQTTSFPKDSLCCKELSDCVQLKGRIACLASSAMLPFAYIATTIARVALIGLYSVGLAFSLTFSIPFLFCHEELNAFTVHNVNGMGQNIFGMGSDAFRFLFMEIKVILGAIIHPSIV